MGGGGRKVGLVVSCQNCCYVSIFGPCHLDMSVHSVVSSLSFISTKSEPSVLWSSLLSDWLREIKGPT